MAVQRISNVSLFNSTMRDVLNTQGSLFELQQQISSGLKSRTFKGLNGQVEQYVSLETKLNRTDMFMQNNQISTARLQTASKSLDSIIDIADKMEDLMVAARSPSTADALNLGEQMRNMLQGVADAMNISFEGRYIFGGTNTNEKPVQNATIAPVEIGVPDTGYYAGSNVSTTIRADDDVQIAFPVRGDDQAFQDLFAAANLAIKAYELRDDNMMARAVDMMQKAQDGLNAAQGRVGAAAADIERISDRQTQLKLYWQGVTEQVVKTDIVAATSKVANDQAALQASYQVFARLIQLKLSDFL